MQVIGMISLLFPNPVDLSVDNLGDSLSLQHGNWLCQPC